MNRSTDILFDAIRSERALRESPASQERRRLVVLATRVARCCRVTLVGRLLAALDRPTIAVDGGLR